jgi:3-hydroxyacyl-[acyl-carrier-protein] dehydratase
MKFVLVDAIVTREPDRIIALKQVSLAEEYLADHFPTFPVLPGVLMVEAMVQAARTLLAERGDRRLVLGEVKAMRFGSFVRPGEALEVEVTVDKALDDGAFACRGIGRVRRPGALDAETAVSGRFMMRPLRTGAVASTARTDARPATVSI